MKIKYSDSERKAFLDFVESLKLVRKASLEDSNIYEINCEIDNKK
jgi:hypothetical protein